MYGTLLGPMDFCYTFKSLNLDSSSLIGLKTILPLTSNQILKCSPVFSIDNISMIPTGNPVSLLIYPSMVNLASLSIQIDFTSLALVAYLSLFLKIRSNGRHSLSLWGPWEGLVA